MLLSALISILVVILVVWLLLYLFNTFVPIDARIKNAVNIVVWIIAAIYCLRIIQAPLGSLLAL